MDQNQESQKNRILEIIKKKGDIDSQALAEEMKLEHQLVVGLIKALETKEIVELEKKEKKGIILPNDGKNCLEKGAPDIQLLKELKANGSQTKKGLTEKLGKVIMGFGFNLAMKAKSITYDKPTDKVSLKIEELPKEDKFQQTVQKMVKETDPSKYDDKLIKDYTKTYKFIKIETIKSFLVKKAKNFELGNVKLENELTADLLANDKWESAKFSKYNYNALGK
jgi:phenylalanyl-tRNA synthetase alpha chain